MGKKIRIYVNDFLYILIYLWIICLILRQSTLNDIKRYNVFLDSAVMILRVLTILVGVRKIKLFRGRNYFAIIILFFITVFNYRYIGGVAVFDLFICSVLFADVDRKRIIDVFFNAIILGIAIVFLIFYFELIPEISVYRLGNVRHTWGFNHPNALGRIFMALSALILCKYKERKTLAKYMTVCAISVLIYMVAQSRTNAIVVFLMGIFGYVFDVIYGNRKALSISTLGGVAYLSPIIICGIVYYMALNSYMFKFVPRGVYKSFLSRFIYGNKVINMFDIKLWGNDIAIYQKLSDGSASSHLMPFDCLYLALPYRYGIIATLFFVVMLVTAIHYFVANGDYVSLLVVIALCIYSICESGVLNMYFSFLFLGTSLGINNVNKDNRENDRDESLTENCVYEQY